MSKPSIGGAGVAGDGRRPQAGALVTRSALYGLAICALACGSPVHAPENYSGDAYEGVIDGTTLAPIFQPNSTDKTVCQGAPSCYLPQIGWVSGHTIAFYNALAVTSTNLPATLGPALATRNSDGTGGVHPHPLPNAQFHPGPHKPRGGRLPPPTPAPRLHPRPIRP